MTLASAFSCLEGEGGDVGWINWHAPEVGLC